MTHAHIFELGIKAYLAGETLTACPYDPAICCEAYEAWKDGWLDASRARWRRQSLAIAVHRQLLGMVCADNRFARAKYQQ